MTRGPKAHILIVEDSTSDAELLRHAFGAFARRFALTWVETLEDARSRMEDTPMDLILADLHLPDGRGDELLIREADDPLVPLVLMTGVGDEATAVRAMKAGALHRLARQQTL